MRSKSASILIACLLVLMASSQNMVDFTFAEIDLQQGRVSKQKESIVIKPNREIIQGYSFPQACYLARKLEDDKVDDSKELASYDMDSMIDNLKIDFIELLKVSEKIKKKKANIEELSEISGRSYNVTVVPPKDLDLLRRHQQKLKEVNSEITAKTQQLEDLVKDSMRNSGGNQFAISSVNFQIESLRLKLDYLRNLKRNNNDAEAAKVKDQYNKYFGDLKIKFDDQNGLIDDLNTILKNFNEIGQLRARIQSLKGQIDVANLMVEEKEACAKERDDIKRSLKNHEEVKAHMSNLREKKKDKSNINNKYCEGVAKKLEDRVKKILLSYDYTFGCAKGLEDMRKKRDEYRIELQKAEERLKYLESSAGIDDYKKKFEQNRQFIKIKQEELSRFTIPEYQHDINEINRLIQKAENQLEDATQRKKDLGTPSGNKVVDYKRIQDLVARIKKLKGIYCQEYEKYDTKATELWNKVQRYEAEVEYSSKIRGVYEEEINELRDLESLFDSLRSKILKRIQ